MVYTLYTLSMGTYWVQSLSELPPLSAKRSGTQRNTNHPSYARNQYREL